MVGSASLSPERPPPPLRTARLQAVTAVGENESARNLGAEIRNRRVALGMSLRGLAKELGLAAHGTLVDYEHGRRIPPEDLIIGCERVFRISDGALRNLRDKALAERADQQADRLLAEPRVTAGAAETGPDPDPGDADPPVAPRLRPWRRRRVVLGVVLGIVGLAALAGAGIGAGVRRSGTTTSSPSSRVVMARWGICWGGQAGNVQPSDAVTYAGAGTLQITVDKLSTDGMFAACTTHGLSTLRPGMKVTFYLRAATADAEAGGVNFWVYNSASKTTRAPETPAGSYEPLPAATGWQKYTWTVPAVDTVHAIGIEVDSTTDRPVILWLGAVTW